MAAALANATPQDLLPARRADESARVELPWILVAHVDLGPSHVPGSRAHLVVVEDGRGERFGIPAVIDGGCLRRARPGDGVGEALLSAIVMGVAPDGLAIEGFPPFEPLAGERAFDVDQTNDLVVVGERAVVKWFLHPTEDEQPAPARLAALARAGFDGTPRPWAIVRLAGESSTALVATVVDYVPHTRDGWEWAVEEVRSFARSGGAPHATWVRDLGVLVAGMHAALLASGTREVTRDEVQGWYALAVSDLERAALNEFDGQRALGLLSGIQECTRTLVMGVHNDLHIGQILRSDSTGKYFIIDFDGNPTLSPSDRLLSQPTARDVAGMMASLDHVGRVVLHRTDDLDHDQRQRVLDWIEDAQVTFLDSYQLALKQGGHPDLLDDRLVLPFQLQQECREYAYAERYLPHWRYVPDAALPALLNRGHL